MKHLRLAPAAISIVSVFRVVPTYGGSRVDCFFSLGNDFTFLFFLFVSRSVPFFCLRSDCSTERLHGSSSTP